MVTEDGRLAEPCNKLGCNRSGTESQIAGDMKLTMIVGNKACLQLRSSPLVFSNNATQSTSTGSLLKVRLRKDGEAKYGLYSSCDSDARKYKRVEQRLKVEALGYAWWSDSGRYVSDVVSKEEYDDVHP